MYLVPHSYYSVHTGINAFSSLSESLTRGPCPPLVSSARDEYLISDQFDKLVPSHSEYFHYSLLFLSLFNARSRVTF